MEPALSELLYGVSREEAMRRAAARAAEKHGREAGEKESTKK